ncbi:hypothetical protein Ddc_09752 [Ditylenchus destructor]|nr:hypothetical protein Ddc_09752 [Ditylenchus destructor]
MSLCFFVDLLICYPQDGGRREIHLTNDKPADDQKHYYHNMLLYTLLPILILTILAICLLYLKFCVKGELRFKRRRHPIAEALLYSGNEPGNPERTTYRYICKPRPAETSSGSIVSDILSDRVTDRIAERNVNVHENPVDFIRIGWTDGRPDVEVRDETKAYHLY